MRDSSHVVSQSATSYDANGNVTAQTQDAQTTSYAWNPQNYLMSVSAPDGSSESYAYCGEGIRRTVTNSDGLRRFIRDGQNILLEADGNGDTIRRYTHRGDAWGALLSLHEGQTSRYYGFDGSANTRVLTDESAGVSDVYIYSAFGEELSVVGNSVNPLRFGGEVGYYRDDAKRVYVRARHLDVSDGRWMSRDPIGFDGGDWNLYRYVGNDSISSSDPSGLRDAEGDYWSDADEIKYQRIKRQREDDRQAKALDTSGKNLGLYGGYGNYCGWTRRGIKSDGVTPGAPTIDCIDACCKAHDQCIAGPEWRYLNPVNIQDCQNRLASCARKCMGDGPGSCGHDNHKLTKWEVSRCKSSAKPLLAYAVSSFSPKLQPFVEIRNTVDIAKLAKMALSFSFSFTFCSAQDMANFNASITKFK